MTDSIAGRSALITGGGSGIGLGTAKQFVQEGAHVTICGRTEERLVSAVVELTPLVVDGGSVNFIVADVTVEAQMVAAVEAATKPTGGLDILFANAGGSFHMGSILDADLDAVRQTIDLNLMGTIISIKTAGIAMKASGGGSIVAMSSGAGHFPHRFLWAYGVAKAGIEMAVRYTAEELAADGIRVNAVQPGIIDDELMSFITAGGALLDDYLTETPAGRVGTVEDVAAAVRFLAGDGSSWVTGEMLAVDGGHHLRRGANYGLLFS